MTSVVTPIELHPQQQVEAEVHVDGRSFRSLKFQLTPRSDSSIPYTVTRRIRLMPARVVELSTTPDLAAPNAIESSVLNLILQKSLRKFLNRTNRGYFERVQSPDLRRDVAQGIRLFRGYAASISVKNFVNGRSLTLNVDPISRVIGLENVLVEMERAIGDRSSLDSLTTSEKARLRRMLIGKAVHTRYNSKPYIIEDIDFTKNPFDYKFELARSGADSTLVSPAEYLERFQKEEFVEQSGRKVVNAVRVSNRVQPLIRTGGRSKKTIYLVPELCCFIEVPRKMKDELPKICSINPTNRFNLARRLVELISGEGAARRVLDSFHLKVGARPIRVRARQLGGIASFDMYGRSISPLRPWGPQTKDLRFPSSGLSLLHLSSVFIITEPGKENAAQQLFEECDKFFKSWNSPVVIPPIHQRFVIAIPDGGDPYDVLRDYAPMQQFLNHSKDKSGTHALVFGVLYGRDHPFKYQRLRQFCGEFGVMEQVVNGEKYEAARAQVVVKANVAKQILNKFGYFVWQADFASVFKPQFASHGPQLQAGFNVMFVGVDVHHAKKTYDHQNNLYRQRRSLGAFIAFMYKLMPGQKAPSMFKVYSDVVAKAARSEIIGRNIDGSGQSSSSGDESDSGAELETPSITTANALQNFLEDAMKSAQFHPHLIVVYRDGVADSQLEETKMHELPQVQNAANNIKILAKSPYSSMIIFNVIQKNISTKFGVDLGNGIGNLPSGTVVDGDVRDTEYLDWFLVSSRERDERGVAMSTVKPVRYIVLQNDGPKVGISPEQIQTFTYTLHGIYPNWTDFVKLPVVTQCAHKFAKTFGDIDLLEPVIHPRLKSTLFFL